MHERLVCERKTQQQCAEFARSKVGWVQPYLALRAYHARCENALAFEVVDDALRAREGHGRYAADLTGIGLLEQGGGQQNACSRRRSEEAESRLFHRRRVTKMWSRDNKNESVEPSSSGGPLSRDCEEALYEAAHGIRGRHINSPSDLGSSNSPIEALQLVGKDNPCQSIDAAHAHLERITLAFRRDRATENE